MADRSTQVEDTDNVCSSTVDGRELAWVDEIRYLGVFMVRALKFKFTIDHAKRSLYLAANSILTKVGRLATEEVVIQLLQYKCVRIMLYPLEVCNLDKRTTQSPFPKYSIAKSETTPLQFKPPDQGDSNLATKRNGIGLHFS